MGTLYDSALKSIVRDKEEERKSFFKPIDDTRITFPTPEKTTGSLYEEALNSLDYDEEQLKDTRTKYQYSADLLKDILIQQKFLHYDKYHSLNIHLMVLNFQ